MQNCLTFKALQPGNRILSKNNSSKFNIDLESSSLYFFRTSTIRICAAKKKFIVKLIDKKITSISVTDDNRNEIFTIHNAEQLMMMMIFCSIKSDDSVIDKHKQNMRQSVALR